MKHTMICLHILKNIGYFKVFVCSDEHSLTVNSICFQGPPKVTMDFFAFAFTGPTIRRDVMANKIKKVEVGVLDGETKYCSLELFHGRLGCNLMNIVCGYNQLVDPASRISLVQLDGFPVFVCRARYFESPINRQARQDRMLKPATYATWTNPSPRRTQP